MAISISIDHDLCQGHGQCQETAPDTFEVRDDGFAYVIGPTDRENLPVITEAATRCPVDAVRIRADDE